MPHTLPRLRAALEQLAPALIRLALKVGDEDPDLVKAAAAYDQLIEIANDLHREADD